MRLIADGVVDRAGVDGLASRLGYSPRQVGRLLTAEVGAAPLALARAQRARTARILVETTKLPMGDIAFAAGLRSIRQFNATMLEVYDIPPTVLRERAARAPRSGRPPTAGAPASPTAGGGGHGATGRCCGCGCRSGRRSTCERMFGYLAARAIPGVEVAAAGRVPPDDQPAERMRPALVCAPCPARAGWTARWRCPTCAT